MKDNTIINETLDALKKTMKLINSTCNENPLYYAIELGTIEIILKKIKDCDATSATKCYTCINEINRSDLYE